MTSKHSFMRCDGEMENLVIIMKVFYLCVGSILKMKLQRKDWSVWRNK